MEDESDKMVDEDAEAPPSPPEPARATRARVTLPDLPQGEEEASPSPPEPSRLARARVTLADLQQGDREVEGATSVQKQMHSLKRATQISDFLKEQAMLMEFQDSAEQRQQKVEDKRQQQEEDELKARYEHTQVKALFRSLETLAQAAADCFFRSGPEEAAYLLQVAIMEAEEEEQVDAPAPALAIAKAGARVLLCTALSQAGAHSDALEAARDAADIIDEVLPTLSSEEDPEVSDDEGSAHSSMASLFEEEAEDQHSAARTARRLRVLERAVELAVQARQCQSLELEFSAARAAVAAMEPTETPEGDISPAEIAAGLRAEIAELHQEGPELARRYLPKKNIVRIAAEKAFCEWQVRSVSITDGSIPPVDPKALRTALAVTRLRKYTSRPAVDGLSLTKHERLYNGIPPLVDLQEERRRRRTEKSLGASSSMPSLDALDEFTKTRSELAMSAKSAPSIGPRPTMVASDLEMSKSSNGKHAGLSQSAATLNFEIGMKESWGKHSVHLGDLYSRSTISKRELPKSSNSWHSVRRSPVGFSIHGPAGKASWALRKEVRRKKNDDGQKINAFEDYRRNASGPKLNVKDQVLQTDGGINLFKNDMKNESKKFKNFWLKEEVTQDELWEDRTMYGTEGVRLMRKSKPPRQPAAHTNEAAALFYYYNVTSPACPETVAGTHTQLAGYGKLLDKSGSYMKKQMPKKRGGEKRGSKEPTKEVESLAALKGLFKL